MQQEKYGFVYIWYDRKHNRFYIGCRWGREDDGYICSSSWMKKSYKKRPQDFKRRILSRIYTNRKELLEEEYRFLSMIKPEELKIRYYNIQNRHFGHWSTDPEKRQKMIDLNTGKKASDKTRQKQREARLGKSPAIKGKTYDEFFGDRAEEMKNKNSDGHMGQIAWNKGKSFDQIKGDNHWTAKIDGMPEETKRKISESKTGKKMSKTSGENHWSHKRKMNKEI